MSLLTFLICAFGGWICICRATKMDSSTKLVIQLQCALWFAMLAAAGLSAIGDAILGEPTPFPVFILSAGVVAHLLLGVPAWRHGQPYYARKGDPLENVTQW